MASHTRFILAPLDRAHLESQNLLQTSEQDGMVKLHRRRLYPSSDEEYKHIPLKGHTEAGFDTDSVFADIPETTISKATILYVGFTPAKAEQLWNRWTNWPTGQFRREIDEDDGGLIMTFKDLLTAHIGTAGSGLLDTSSENDAEWYQCLDNYGLSKETQAKIINPLFAYIRKNQACAYWARDTVEMRYAGLEEIQLASLERETKLRQAATGSGQPSTPAGGHASGSSSSASFPTGSAGASQSGASQSLAGQSQGQGTVTVSTRSTIERAVRNTPGYTLLFKGMDVARTRRLFDESGRVQNLAVLATPAPTDFSIDRSLFYFSAQYAVAEYYAAYAKERAGCLGVIIVTIAVPNAAIERLQPPAIQRLFWSDEWASMIWHCRGSRELPLALDQYDEALLTIGHIARFPNGAYERMKSAQDIKESHVLHVEGPDGPTKAVQYVFNNKAVRWLWDNNAAQTVKEYAFTARDLAAWVQENRARGVA